LQLVFLPGPEFLGAHQLILIVSKLRQQDFAFMTCFRVLSD